MRITLLSITTFLLLTTLSLQSFAQTQTQSQSQSLRDYYRPIQNEYEVTITNLTFNQVFSPLLVASHLRSIALFEVGEPASDGVALMAEAGDVSGIVASVDGDRRVRGAGVSEGPLLPGQSTTVTVPANRGNRISVVSMLVNTNDAFLALNSVTAPRFGRSETYYAVAYDAGSEPNDELCANIPGPACGGQGASAEDGEGFIHIHRGFHGVGDLEASRYDWRNPVAKITVTRK